MNRTIRSLVAASALFAASFAWAEDRSFDATVWADIGVDASGHVTDVAIPGKLDGNRLGDFLLAKIRTWEFIPARHNDVAVPARTSLQVTLAITQHGDDFQVAVREAAPSPRPVKVVAPRYPLSAVQRHVQGEVRIALTVKPDGTVAGASCVSAHYDPGLAKAAIDAVSTWTFAPEVVDGVAVETHAEVPILYIIPGRAPAPQAAKRQRVAMDALTNQQVVADAAVKLKSDVAAM